MSPPDLWPTPLTRPAFAAFGDVIEARDGESYAINEGTTERFNDLASVDTGDRGGRPLISIFRGKPRVFPFHITMMERHPLASQAFVPLHRQPYLVVVAATTSSPGVDDLHAFLASGGQGVNYRRGIWHHPLLCVDRESDFLVIDRGGQGENLEETWFDQGCFLAAEPA